jgi:hypothetical protein
MLYRYALILGNITEHPVFHPFVLFERKEMPIATYKVAGFPLHAAFKITIVQCILGNYLQPQVSRHQNRKALHVLDEFQDLLETIRVDD